MDDISHYIRIVEAANDPVIALLHLLSLDTRISPDEAIAGIDELRDQIPDDCRHVSGYLWRYAGITVENTRKLLSGETVPTTYRKYASFTQDRDFAELGLAHANSQHPVVAYRVAPDMSRVIINTNDAPRQTGFRSLPQDQSEVLVEMTPRMGAVSRANAIGVVLTPGQYQEVFGQEFQDSVSMTNPIVIDPRTGRPRASKRSLFDR